MKPEASTFLDVLLRARAEKKILIAPHVAKWVVQEKDEEREYNRKLTKNFIINNLSQLSRAAAIEVDDIAEAIFTTGNDYRFPASFPLCMPPFESTFFGFHRPSKLEGKFETEEDRNMDPVERARLLFPKRMGVLVSRSPFQRILKRILDDDFDAVDEDFFQTMKREMEKDEKLWAEFTADPVKTFERYVMQFEEKSIFFCHASVYIDADFFPDGYDGVRPAEGSAIGPMCSFTWCVRKNGEMFGDDSFQSWAMDDLVTEGLWKSLSVVFWPALLGISLMNAKNVRVEEVRPSEKINRRLKKEGKPPLVTYRKLIITPMEARRSAEQANSDGKAESTAEHIVRGHFGDYTKGKGLFGRTKGLFWFMEHRRGSPEAGAVVKDYEVKGDT